LRDAAAELGAGQAELVPQDPEQGRFRFDVELMGFSVDDKGNHERTSNGRVQAARASGERGRAKRAVERRAVDQETRRQMECRIEYGGRARACEITFFPRREK
jgi:hypothetical protein